jgi:hypothetical protein
MSSHPLLPKRVAALVDAGIVLPARASGAVPAQSRLRFLTLMLLVQPDDHATMIEFSLL